jgi:hypothetical protein
MASLDKISLRFNRHLFCRESVLQNPENVVSVPDPMHILLACSSIFYKRPGKFQSMIIGDFDQVNSTGNSVG